MSTPCCRFIFNCRISIFYYYFYCIQHLQTFPEITVSYVFGNFKLLDYYLRYATTITVGNNWSEISHKIPIRVAIRCPSPPLKPNLYVFYLHTLWELCTTSDINVYIYTLGRVSINMLSYVWHTWRFFIRDKS